jgi:hypothetical protein
MAPWRKSDGVGEVEITADQDPRLFARLRSDGVVRRTAQADIADVAHIVASFEERSRD